ncbi:hypothetical protein L6164_031214 [Bauhinia variegata]|uniref:Uncharacterized protein n=1 Tax=Bauhinia variegata TaxID=167791 RepID=A0ACB9LF39_BAUVA|nr:hypothetical protein L6164_031214 [Bauhinia variegata]
MGKKVSQATLKISKNYENKHQFNSLIKVLRPKVYITDSSSFKKLVQELTGNGSSTPLSPPPLEPKLTEAQDQRCKHETAFETLVDHRDLESFEASVFTGATTNSEDLSFPGEEFDAIYKHLCMDDELLEDCTASQSLVDDLFAYQNLESLLLFDAEANDQFPNCFSHIQQEEVSIYDYEVSGLMI